MLEGFNVKAIGKVSILHVVFLTMTFIGLKNHVTVIPLILRDAERDGWASVLFSAVGLIPWLFLLVYIQKKTNQEPIKDWLKEKIGKFGSKIVLYVTAVFLIILAALTMIETLHWVTTSFLPRTPVYLLLIIYTFLCIFLAATNIQTIAIVNVFVLFVVIILGFFVGITNIQVKEYELLLPFFEHGFSPVLKGMIHPASGYIELLLLLFLQHQFKEPIRWYHYMIMLFILMMLTMGPLVGSIIEFGPTEAAKQKNPAYEEWGLLVIGRFVEHLDFLSIYQWLTGALIRIGLILYVVVDILNMTEDKKRIWKIIAPFFLIICWLLLFLTNRKFLELKLDYSVIGTFIYLFLLSIFLASVAIISGKSSKKKELKNTERSVK